MISMQIKSNAIRTLYSLMALTVTSSIVLAQDSVEKSNPLTNFAPIIGSWTFGETIQKFTWGPGEKSVNVSQQAVKDNDTSIVTTGLFFYHPGDNSVKGYFSAVNMGIDLFEYTSVTFSGDTIFADLTTYGDYGGEFKETWVATDADHWTWTLYQVGASAATQLMTGVFERAR